MKNNNIFNSEYQRDLKFNGITFSDSIIAHKEFYKCSFENCHMNKSNFDKCRFEDCDFINCDISLSKFNMSEFIDVRFIESKMLGINWTEVEGTIRIELRKCKLDHSTFFGLNLKSKKVEWSSLHFPSLD
jgi:fluoroquinolone resistance protein